MSNLSQQIRAALRRAFPAAKFSVQHNGRDVHWTDDGPTVEQVEQVITPSVSWNSSERQMLRCSGPDGCAGTAVSVGAI